MAFEGAPISVWSSNEEVIRDFIHWHLAEFFERGVQCLTIHLDACLNGSGDFEWAEQTFVIHPKRLSIEPLSCNKMKRFENGLRKHIYLNQQFFVLDLFLVYLQVPISVLY
jgi:hypothetical protein